MEGAKEFCMRWVALAQEKAEQIVQEKKKSSQDTLQQKKKKQSTKNSKTSRNLERSSSNKKESPIASSTTASPSIPSTSSSSTSDTASTSLLSSNTMDDHHVVKATPKEDKKISMERESNALHHSKWISDYIGRVPSIALSFGIISILLVLFGTSLNARVANLETKLEESNAANAVLQDRVFFLQTLVEILSENITGTKGDVQEHWRYWTENSNILNRYQEWTAKIELLQEELARSQLWLDKSKLGEVFRKQELDEKLQLKMMEMNARKGEYSMLWWIIFLLVLVLVALGLIYVNLQQQHQFKMKIY
jgi:hypothetical protein